VVPVLYVLVFTPRKKRAQGSRSSAVVLALLLLGVPPLSGADAPETRRLSLEEAIQGALQNSSGVRIARAKVQEAQAKQRVARADYLPHLTADASWMRLSNNQTVTIPAGALGNIPGMGPFPVQDASFTQGKSNLYLQNITLGQPLTQLFKIYQGNQVVGAEERQAQAELRKMEADIAFKTRQIYVGLLIARAQKEAAQASVAAAELQDLDAREAVKAGNALKVLQTGSRAQLLLNRHKQLSAEATLSDLSSELNDLMGQSIDTPLALSPMAPKTRTLPSREALLEEALMGNPDLAVAKETLEKSRSGLKAGKAEYIPGISAFARQTHQEGVPFLQSNSTTVGLTLSWSILDWGKKAGVVSQRAALVSQATENHRRLRNRVEIDLGKLLRKRETAQLMVEVAEEACSLNVERARLTANQHKAGLVSASKKAEAEAAARTAEADFLAARLGLDLAYAELEQLLGKH
jgi:outer membrane protein TolC